MAAEQEDASPVLHSDMGRQYQHAACVETLDRNGFTQSVSRKGSCIGNGTAEQVFGHLKDEFYRDRDWETFEEFKADLEAYIQHWNHVRRQVRLKGLTPVEFRDQALQGDSLAVIIYRVQFLERSSIVWCSFSSCGQ